MAMKSTSPVDHEVVSCPKCGGLGGIETIHYDESGYGNPPERTLERCPCALTRIDATVLREGMDLLQAATVAANIVHDWTVLLAHNDFIVQERRYDRGQDATIRLLKKERDELRSKRNRLRAELNRLHDERA